MRRCPHCRRDYYDETLLYCLDDGAHLVDGPASDESITAIYDESSAEALTRAVASPDGRGRWAANRSSLIAGIIGFAIVGVLGIGGYFYYGRADARSIGSIAVLPFENRSAEADTDYLSDGLAESLMYRLSRLPDLKVTPASTVFRYKGDEAGPAAIGRKLGVDAVVSGKITQRGDNLTISVDLIDVSGEKLLWGEQYERKLADLLTTRREIAAQIVKSLAIRVAGSDKNYTENNEAYRLYLKGRYFWNKRDAEATRKAIEYFNQAIAIDPGFALAYAGLADAYVIPANRMAPHEAMPRAKKAAMRALEIDDSLAEAHTSLARVLQVYDWNWAEAEQQYKRAIELDPRYPVAHQWYGGYLERTGRLDLAVAERNLSLQLDPLSAITNFELGQTYVFMREYDKALDQFRKVLELEPNFPAAHQYIPLALIGKGMLDEAMARVQSENEGRIGVTGVSGYVYAVAGRTDEARKKIEELKKLRGQPLYISPTSIAAIYSALGQSDEAIEWLEKGYEERAFQMQTLNLDPRWDNIRSDPRFADLVRRIGFPPG